MNSKEALYLLMTNQKKVRDDFTFINLNTHEKVSIEECYDIVIKDLEVLEILKNYIDFYTCRDTDGQSCINLIIPESVMNYTIIKEWLENDI